MDLEKWTSIWEAGVLHFHQSSVSTALDDFGDLLFDPDKPGRVYVPLCGKSLDLVFLAERSTEVLGVEFVEQAVKEFFAEQDLTPEVETDPYPKYSAANYTLFATDFFNLTAEHLGPIDLVFDRAAMVALDDQTRVRYADHWRSLLPVGAELVVVTFDYDQDELTGPPFAISTDEVERLYADGFSIKMLDTRDVLNDEFRSQGVTEMTESLLVLTRV